MIALLAVVVGTAACGGGGPSVSTQTESTTTSTAEPSTSTSSTVPESSTTTSTSEPGTTTTTTTPVAPPGMQLVASRGLRFAVPVDWPVHDLTSEPTRCVRVDTHAVFLGEQGPRPDCPANVIGRTETVQVRPLTPGDVDAELATDETTINGIPVRVDPEAATNRALVTVFPAQDTVVVVTFRDDRALADGILRTFTTT